MPPIKTGKRLTTEQLEVLRRWIDQGAEYKTHRFFLPPQPSELPAVNDKKWPRNPIDYYILSRLEQEGLKPAAAANRRSLIRRLKLDLLDRRRHLRRPGRSLHPHRPHQLRPPLLSHRPNELVW
jgi:hypothetical protein